MPIYNSVLDTIGRTPLVRLNKLTEGLSAGQSDAEFDAALDAAIAGIYAASLT